MKTPEESSNRLEEIRVMLTAPYLVKAKETRVMLTAPYLVKAKEIMKNLVDNNPIDAIDTKEIIDRNWS